MKYKEPKQGFYLTYTWKKEGRVNAPKGFYDELTSILKKYKIYKICGKIEIDFSEMDKDFLKK